MDAVLGTISGAVVGGPALKAPPPALPSPSTTALPLPPWPPPTTALKAPPPALTLPSTTALPLLPWPPPAAKASPASVLRAVLWGNAMVLWGNASASVLRAVLCAMVLWGNAVRAVLWVAGVSDRGAVLGRTGGGGASFSDESSVVEVAPGGAVLGASSSDSSSSVGTVARAPS